MAKKSEQLTLDELRDKSVKSGTTLSFSKEMGGYNKKQVTEYIDNLAENLHSAEESFNNRIEEYAAMITMLKQERDQYGEMYNLCKSSKAEMSGQIDELKKENEELAQLLHEQRSKHDAFIQAPVNTDESEDHLLAQKKLEQYLCYEQESNEMKIQLDQLKKMVNDLNDELQNYAKENNSEDNSISAEALLRQQSNDILKSQYEDILTERSALLTEKRYLEAENKNLSEENTVLSEHLKNAKEQCDKRIEDLSAVFQANIAAFINNHQETLIQLTENMNSSLNLIKTNNQS